MAKMSRTRYTIPSVELMRAQLGATTSGLANASNLSRGVVVDILQEVKKPKTSCERVVNGLHKLVPHPAPVSSHLRHRLHDPLCLAAATQAQTSSKPVAFTPHSAPGSSEAELDKIEHWLMQASGRTITLRVDGRELSGVFYAPLSLFWQVEESTSSVRNQA